VRNRVNLLPDRTKPDSTALRRVIIRTNNEAIAEALL